MTVDGASSPAENGPSRRPYRDTAVVYGVMAGALVALAAALGSDLVRAVAVALLFFLLATGWSWWRLRARLERPAQQAASGDGEEGK